jgi:hypothetical protein
MPERGRHHVLNLAVLTVSKIDSNLIWSSVTSSSAFDGRIILARWLSFSGRQHGSTGGSWFERFPVPLKLTEMMRSFSEVLDRVLDIAFEKPDFPPGNLP